MQALWQFLRTLVLPQGATTGARIVLDGTNGVISIYNSSNKLVGQWGGSLGRFFVGVDLNDVTQPKVELDPSDIGLELGGGGPGGFRQAFMAWSNFNYASELDISLVDSTNATLGTMTLAPGESSQSALTWVAGQKLTPVFVNNFTGSGFGQNFEVWIDSDDCLRMTGCIAATAAIASGTVQFGNSVGITPVHTTNAIGLWTDSSNVGKGTVQVRFNSSTGTFSVATGGLASGDRIYVNAFCPLGNV